MDDGSWEIRNKRSAPAFDVAKPSCGTETNVPNQIPFKSLKSCRGDPMSLVKTLQQQSHQPPVVSRPSFDCAKRYVGPDFLQRVPPPAHHNAFNQVQNGYFELDRWNSAKIFSTGAPKTDPAKFSIHVPSSNSSGGFPTFLPALPAVASPPTDVSVAGIDESEHRAKSVTETPFVGATAQGTREEPLERSTDGVCTEQQQEPPEGSFRDENRVPSIEEELGLGKDAVQTEDSQLIIDKSNPSVGFMKEFLRFIRGSESEADAPPSGNTDQERGSNSTLNSRGDLNVSPNVKNDQRPQHAELREPSSGIETNEKRPQQSPVAPPVFPFPVGDFVVVKSDRVQLHPPVWRVKKNYLLQKFTHFVSRGVAFYSNVPLFVGWSPATKKVYEKVEFEFVKRKKEDWIIKLKSAHLLSPLASASFERGMTENRKHREAFDVYVQILLSHALDPKFLRGIGLEKNAHLLAHSNQIESFCGSLVDKLKEKLPWDETLIENMGRSPNYRYEASDRQMCVCGHKRASSSVVLGGPNYSQDTLELLGTSHPKQAAGLCDSCREAFELLHKLSHQKYLLYSVCQSAVSTSRSSYQSRTEAATLSKLLADGKWFEEVFEEFLTLWAYVDFIVGGLADK